MALHYRSCKNVHSIPDKKTDVYKVENVKDINVKLQYDFTSCNIFGSCWTEDGLLLLVDHNSRKLKRVNITSMALDGFCSFDILPHSVCCTNRQEAVVTFYTDKCIQFVSLGSQLKLTRKVEMNHSCLGIAFKGDKLYITDGAQAIYIHNIAGDELQKISQDNSGNIPFHSCRQITFGDSIYGVYVADWNKGVIILDKQYHQVASFNGSGLSRASAVCTDGCGNIFVCGYSSHNVIQIGYDGKKRGVVVDKSHGLLYPRSVCFDPVHCRLIVTQDSETVKIFDIK